jgi:hypothetical protein
MYTWTRGFAQAAAGHPGAIRPIGRNEILQAAKIAANKAIHLRRYVIFAGIIPGM